MLQDNNSTLNYPPQHLVTDFTVSISTTALIAFGGLISFWVLSWIHLALKTQRTSKRLDAAKKKGIIASFEDIPTILGYPIVGISTLALPYLIRKRFDLFLSGFNKKLGKLVNINVGASNFLLVVEDSAIAKKALNDDETFVRKDILQKLMADISPFALFLIPSGDTWKIHRKGLQPAFGPIHLRDAVEVAIETADRLLEVWASTKTRNVMEDFTMATCDLITKIVFSADLGAIQSLVTDSGDHLHHHLSKIAGALEKRFANVATKFMWPLYGASESQIKPSVQKIRNMLQKIINEKKESIAKNSVTPSGENIWARDLLDRLLASDAQFTDEEIMSEVFGFFFAGHETTANTMTWAVAEFVQKPEIRKKLMEEVDQVLKGTKPTYEVLSKLRYLDVFFKEVLRFHSVLRYNIRVTAKEAVLTTSDGCSVAVPADVGILISTYKIHTSPEYWGENANEFVPERWFVNSEGSTDGFVPVPGSYLPFGDGHMSCIGQKVALIAMKVMLIRIMQQFEVTLSPKQGPIEPVSAISVGLKDGLLVDTKLRK